MTEYNELLTNHRSILTNNTCNDTELIIIYVANMRQSRRSIDKAGIEVFNDISV